MLRHLTRLLTNAFTRNAAFTETVPKPAAADTATLDTKHGLARMDRLVLSCGSVAYLCHKESRPENAVLDIDRVDYTAIDRNTSEAPDIDNIMCETSEYGHKSDFCFYAEQVCNQRPDMDRATVVVFFDHLAQSVNAPAALRELRERFPAASPALDRMEAPPQPQGPRKLVEVAAGRPATAMTCGLCG